MCLQFGYFLVRVHKGFIVCGTKQKSKRARLSRCGSCTFYDRLSSPRGRPSECGDRVAQAIDLRSGGARRAARTSGASRRRGRERGVLRSADRPQDGQRAAVGASVARPAAGAGARPAALQPPRPRRLAPPLGAALHAATPRCARERGAARRHLPQGARHPQQTHTGEVPEAQR